MSKSCDIIFLSLGRRDVVVFDSRWNITFFSIKPFQMYFSLHCVVIDNIPLQVKSPKLSNTYCTRLHVTKNTTGE